MIELDRGAAAAAPAIEPHQPLYHRLVHGIELEQPEADLCRPFGVSGLVEQGHEPCEDVDEVLSVLGGFGAAPRLELLAVNVEPVEELAGIEPGGRFQGVLQLRGQAAKGDRVDLESRGIKHDVVTVGDKNVVFRVIQRLPQPPDGGAQVVERGLIGVVAPQERQQLAAGLAALRAQRKIGQQNALALSGQRDAFSAGQGDQLEATEQPKRPARVRVRRSSRILHAPHRPELDEFSTV